LNLSADDVGHCRRFPAIPHMHHVEAGHGLEKLACHVTRRSRAAGGHADLALALVEPNSATPPAGTDGLTMITSG
jgi:hypothetical protein